MHFRIFMDEAEQIRQWSGRLKPIEHLYLERWDITTPLKEGAGTAWNDLKKAIDEVPVDNIRKGMQHAFSHHLQTLARVASHDQRDALEDNLMRRRATIKDLQEVTRFVIGHLTACKPLNRSPQIFVTEKGKNADMKGIVGAERNSHPFDPLAKVFFQLINHPDRNYKMDVMRPEDSKARPRVAGFTLTEAMRKDPAMYEFPVPGSPFFVERDVLRISSWGNSDSFDPRALAITRCHELLMQMGDGSFERLVDGTDEDHDREQSS